MFSFFKSNFQFEVIVSDSIESETITSPEGLINYVIGVNNHLIKEESNGWIYAEKFKESKKGKELLYALKVDLPLYEDNPYFDQLLSPFYTKKKMPFEEVILQENKQEKVKETSSPALPPELQALADEGKDRLEIETNSESMESSEQIMPVKEEEQAEQQQLIDRLMYQLEMKQEEIEQLKEDNATNQQTINTISSSAGNEQETIEQDKQSNSIPPKKYSGLSLDKSEQIEVEKKETISPESETTADVSGVLDLVTKEFTSRLSKFTTEEKKKINQEIQVLDKRHLIESEVTKKIEEEKQRAKEHQFSTLENERKDQLAEERQRHEVALAAIERSFAEKKTTTEAEIETQYSKQLATEISAEYETQTEQLSRILQGKMDELKFKQKEMNEGLEKNFAQVLAAFNATHEKVIEQVEQQKEANQPIDFLKHKKVVG
ncbi:MULTISPECIES: hypothetical protein [unclassified Enterococcus]|uniref:hypothetical protein n=1 Tax=unclassified Enterococcus TaxID=2608891 RepID=UPI001CE14B30|nr:MULTISPECIES: hypothetical protein [unclassified Enterococcus]MCA5014561.1 hypothetical protein [Enterococcus sp. S23]MCA5017814.1 hypothetical protein [Enterococcus sp. S22(2020)]